MTKHLRKLIFAALAATPAVAVAQDVSKPAVLQWFEGTWTTIEKRQPDLFMAGYGAMWLPPPGRASQGSSSVGYDVYDRFDLGSAGTATLYGTERRLKALTTMSHRFGGRVYTDLILNHNGFDTRFTSGFTASGGYPGFALTRGDDVEGDFHQQNYNGGDPFLQRISGLIDIAQEKNHQYTRNPIPGFANNVPAGTTSFFGKLANIPSENNRRFYPDQQLGGVTYTDPTLPAGQQQVTMYDYNTATPLSGDPVSENAQTYLMRHARWMIQEIGVDGFRLDAVKHFPPAVLNEFDRYVYKAVKTPLLNGQPQHTFSFGEALDGNRGLLQNYIKKNVNSVGSLTVGGNRDMLDYPLFFALRDNLSSTNGNNNNWNNVVNASQDVNDDGLANNGSQGLSFTMSHDDVQPPPLQRVAHAYSLMRPGEALVYFNAKEFGNGRSFPKDGRFDALGGLNGDRIIKLVQIRNSHGRGNYTPRIGGGAETHLLAYERDRSAVVFLSNYTDIGFDTRTIQTNFAVGTKLVDLTGNATNAAIDTNGSMPDVATVDGQGRITITVPRNGNGGTLSDNGYVIYGLATPAGSLSVSNVASTIAAQTPTANTNGTARLTAMDVITANNFTISLNTIPVVLPDGTTDANAGGNRAYVKLNGGLDVNANGAVDFTNPNGTQYGFENFVTTNSPLVGGGDGQFTQTIDATGLPEGPNYIEARAFRARSDGGPDVFTSFRKVIYVDRFAPESAFDSIVTLTNGNRDFRVRSLDQTADAVHILLNQPITANIVPSAGNRADQIDRDIFAFDVGTTSLRSGNQVITHVTFELSGNTTIVRETGVLMIIPGRGLGLGDLNGDNTYGTSDVNGTQGMEILVYPNLQGQTNTQFGLAGAPADLDGNGLLDTRDLLRLRETFIAASAPAAAITEARNAELRRGNIDNAGGINGNAADIDFLYSRLGATGSIWREDLNVDGAVTAADIDVLIGDVFLTRLGDANLDTTVNISDFSQLASNFNTPGGWANGNFNGDALVNIADFSLLAANFNLSGPVASTLSRGTVPEPSALVLFGFAVLLLGQRRVQSVRLRTH